MYDQTLEIKIALPGHDGWTTLFHQDVIVPLHRPNVIPFRNNLRKELEKIMNEKWLTRHINMASLHRNGNVLQFTYYHPNKLGRYLDSFTMHIKMTEEGWNSGLVEFAEKIWRN